MDQLQPTSGTVVGKNSLDIDHFNPVRADNENTKVLQANLPVCGLTSRRGAPAFIAWHCTGQGFMTRDFANSHEMLFSGPRACISTFTTDKAELHFGAMFVEHLLCKISRYQSIFLKDPLAGTVTLVSLGEIAQQKQGSGWVSGANTLDCTKFPIPLNANRDELKASLRYATRMLLTLCRADYFDI
jgi:hypothetical protein